MLFSHNKSLKRKRTKKKGLTKDAMNILKKKGNENLSTYLSYIIVVYVKRRVSSCEKVKVAHGIRVGKAF